VVGTQVALLIGYSSNVVAAGNKCLRLNSPGHGAFQVYRSRNIRLLNNEVESSNNGVLLVHSEAVEIRGNRIRDSAWGVWLHRSDRNVIEGNSFDRNTENVRLVESTANRISRNNFRLGKWQGSDDRTNAWSANFFDDRTGAETSLPYPLMGAGMDMEPAAAAYAETPVSVPEMVRAPRPKFSSTFEFIRQDTLWSNCEREIRGQLHVENGATLTIRNCTIRSAPLDQVGGWMGIMVNQGAGLVVERSTIGSDGVRSYMIVNALPGSRLTIRDSRLEYLGTWGAALDSAADDAWIENNDVIGSYAALRVSGGLRARVVNNRIADSVTGIGLDGSAPGIAVERNRISDIVLAALQVSSPKAVVRQNIIERSGRGIELYDAQAVVSGNQVRDCRSGIMAVGSNNLIAGNVFWRNLPRAETGGGDQINSNGATNRWDDNGRGNYYSDYAGPDANNDGIGDTPYPIRTSTPGVEVMDRFPLMRPPESQQCAYWLGERSLAVPGADNEARVALSAGAGCAWKAAAGAEWLTLTSSAEGAGDTTVTFRVSANPSASYRAGTLAVGGQTLTVLQAPRGCSYSIDPASAVGVQRGGEGTVKVTAPAGCPWAVSSDAFWLRVLSPVHGFGEGVVRYSWSPQGSPTPRLATLSIAGQSLPFTLRNRAGRWFSPAAL